MRPTSEHKKPSMTVKTRRHIFWCSLVLLSVVSTTQAALNVTALGKAYAPPADRTPIGATRSNLGGSTSIRNTDADHLIWKRQGYYQRNRDLGQTFVPPCDFRLDAIVLRTGPSDSAVKPGAPGAEVFVQFFDVIGEPRINDNDTGPGTDAKHGFSTNHRCDDFIEGVRYRSIRIVGGGLFPDLPPTLDEDGRPTGDDTGKLHYLRFDLTGNDELVFSEGKRYAFMIGFVRPAPGRAFTLGNYNAAGVAAPASMTDDHDLYHDGWGLRREGNGTLPPTMTGRDRPPGDTERRGQLVAESVFPDRSTRYALTPTTDGYPDVDTYRDHEFYLEVHSKDSPTVTKTGDSVVDANALTIAGGFGQAINGLSFQQDAVVTHRGFQCVGYYDGGRRVCLARRKLPAGPWQVVRFADYDFKSNDAHNIISIGICPQDGTIHMAFDHHGHPKHYRASRPGVATDPEAVTWDASLFGPIHSDLEKGKPIRITYPRFWQTPVGGLQFCFRQGGSGNGDRMLVDYDAKTGTWRHTRQIDSHAGLFEDAMGQSRSRCSYPNGYDYGPDGRLHVTWVWRESSQGSNHDLMYAYSTDGGVTWRNNAGQLLKEPAHVNTRGITAVPISRQHGLMNTHGQAIDSQGRVHVVMWHCTDESIRVAGSTPGEYRWGPPAGRRYFHYWRDRDGHWHHTELPWIPGSRPKIFMDRNDNAYMIYGTRAEGVEPVAKARPLNGDLVIVAATSSSKWTDWRVVHREPGPFVNEMLGDRYRWKAEGVLSVMVQESPEKKHEATALRILDFAVK